VRKTLRVWVVVGVVGCGGAGEAAPALSDRVEEEVATFLGSYLTAVETRDVALLRTLYADDGRFQWIEDGEVRYRSPDDVLAGLTALPIDAAIRTEYDGRGIARVGNSGARVSTRFHPVIGEGPGAFECGGMMTMVLERGPTDWRIVGGHTSSARQDGR